MAEEKFHEIALFWCDENNIEKYKTLNEYDIYFKNLYENWEWLIFLGGVSIGLDIVLLGTLAFIVYIFKLD